jgi:hypothetical protein
MSRRIGAFVTPATAVVALLMGTTATAAPVTVNGKAGPGYTISLMIGGKSVKKLKAGITYRFVISDRSKDHDFWLVGPGTSRLLTGEEFTGKSVPCSS